MLTKEEKSYTAKALLTELLGTGLLVGTCTTIMTKYSDTQASMVASAIVCGAVVAAVIYSFDQYSGGHANPAVTLGFAFSGRMKWGLAIGYIIAQLFGAILSLMIVSYFLGGYSEIKEMDPGSLFDTDNIKLVCLTALTTALFVGAFLLITKNPFIASAGGLAIGTVFALTTLGVYKYAGADAMNPAMVLTSKGSWTRKWLVILGAVIGSVIAAIIFRLLDHKAGARNAVDCDGKQMKDKCGRDLVEIECDVLDKCGKPMTGACGEPLKTKRFELKQRCNHHQQNPAMAVMDAVHKKTGISPQVASNRLEREISSKLSKVMN